MKKVLFISSLYYPHVGGIETMITELAKFYKEKGIVSISLTKKWPVTLLDKDEFEGTKIYRVPNARDEAGFNQIIDWLKDNDTEIRADIIHVIGIRRPLPLIALLLSKYWQVPIVCTVAGGDIPDNFDPMPTKVWEEGLEFIPEVLKQSDHVNCVSDALVDTLKEVMPNLKNIGRLYAGIDVSVINNAEVEKIKNEFIFSFRRLDPSKGVSILIEAFNIIKDAFPAVHLVIAGEGSEEKKLKALVDKYAINDRVIFIGTVSLPRGIALLKGALATVVPSLSEGGGLVNIEAQAAGCPIIASRVGGILEYVKEDESALLFSPGDYKELAEKLTLILSDSVLRSRLSCFGLEYVKKFDWNVLAPQYIDMYQKLIIDYNKNLDFVAWSDLSKNLWERLIK